MNDLGVQHIYQGCRDKLAAFESLLQAVDLEPEQVAYVGDDLPDLPIMQRVGFAAAPSDAQPAVTAR